MNKQEILETALKLVTGDRNDTHGDAYDQLSNVGRLWSEYTGYPHDAMTVATCMVLMKLSRSIHGKFNPDDYIDMVGYAAIAGEIAARDNGQG